MSDVVKSLLGRAAFQISWIFANAIVIGAASLALLPTAQQLGIAQVARSWDKVTSGLVLTATVVLAGFTMATVSTPLYRLLEGYVRWIPSRLYNWGVRRQKAEKVQLEAELDELEETQSLRRALISERLDRYPVDNRDIAPTRFGNALRAMERYAINRYKLDSQRLWSELYAVSPQAVRDDLENSRTTTDFFVAVIYLTALYGLAALGLTFGRYLLKHTLDAGLLGQAVAVLLGGPWLGYQLAISSTDYWASAIQATVNIGRVKLAEAYGLAMPRTLTEERKMWGRLTDFVGSPYEYRQAVRLNEFRIASQPDQVRRSESASQA